MNAVLTSRKNELVKDYLLLSGSAPYRREAGVFAAEGARLCADAAASGLTVRRLFFTQEAEKKYGKYLSVIRKGTPEEYPVSESVAESLSDTKTPQGVFCICSMPKSKLPEAVAGKETRFLILENIQDPANLGAVFRTAEALGISGVLLGGSCCDVFSPKALRAAMGAPFRLPFELRSDAAEAVRELNEKGFSTYAAVPDETAIPVSSLAFSGPCAAAIGNEGNGLTDGTINACSARVTIPMAGRAESLNAASSAAILMWEMMRGNAGGDR